jgi:acetoacetyl-CoA synthetase
MPEILWSPTSADLTSAEETRFRQWLVRERSLVLPDHEALWQWSTSDLAGFWSGVAEYFGVESSTPVEAVLTGTMPEVRWFAGATVNYTQQVFRKFSDERPALVVCGEDEAPREVSWRELRHDVAAFAASLRQLGVTPGDRVVAFLPNRLEAVVGLLATAAIGAVWAACSPDFGAEAALSRFRQLEPTVLIAVDGYRFGGRDHDRREERGRLAAALNTLDVVVTVGERDGPGLGGHPTVRTWSSMVADDVDLETASVPFEHPLWVLFSSGTTGTPKGIVHGHGGIVLEQLKAIALGGGIGPGDRFYFFSSTSWMVWNHLVGALLAGATPVLYDGAPGQPDLLGSWRVAAAAGAHVAGFGAAYLVACARAEADLGALLDLGRLRTVVSTGSPLPTTAWRWLHKHLPGVRIESSSGGTDICSAIACGSPVLPVTLGELSTRALGVKAEVWDRDGTTLIDEPGELVITAPMPSMPTQFWNDPDRSRYRASYFDTYPGVWRHGDRAIITNRGTVVVEGRSDSTLNRGGIRMGSSEIYAAVELVEDIADSLIVGVELPDGGYFMPLFVELGPGAVLDDALRERIVQAVRTQLSPRHLPDEIVAVPAIPRTSTGKRVEVPVKRLLAGDDPGAVVDPSTLAEPSSIEWYIDYATRHQAAATMSRRP